MIYLLRSFGAQLLAKAQAAVAVNKVEMLAVPYSLKSSLWSQIVRANEQSADDNMPLQLQIPVAIPPDAAVGRAGRKPAKKVAIKNKEEKIVALIPAKNEESKQTHSKSSRKMVPTLTSVLTARSKVYDQLKHLYCIHALAAIHLCTITLIVSSKVACGLVDKPKELVDDIDAADAEDQLAVVDYIEDIYKFYRSAEVCVSLRSSSHVGISQYRC